ALYPLCLAERDRGAPLDLVDPPGPGNRRLAQRPRRAGDGHRLPRSGIHRFADDCLHRQLALVGIPDGPLLGGDAEHPAGPLRGGPPRRGEPVAGVQGRHHPGDPAGPRVHGPDDQHLVVPDVRLHLDHHPGWTGRGLRGAVDLGLQKRVPKLRGRVRRGDRDDDERVRRRGHLGVRRPAPERMGDL
ncbi:MAG: N-acetyl-D-glucosamine ABC transporter, permease protein 1, partial [uncultured Thermomicrobiales bacterium]